MHQPADQQHVGQQHVGQQHVDQQHVDQPLVDQQDVDQQREYRQWLVETDHKSSQAYDRTVLTLAAGALGLSLAFMKDAASHQIRESFVHLLRGWECLGSSLTATLVSMLTSQFALRTAIW